MKSIKLLKLNDGQTVKLVFTFEDLYNLKMTYATEYEKFCKLIFEGLHGDLISYIEILYTCYLMANQESSEKINLLSFDQFLKKVDGIDVLYLVKLATSLTSSKKNKYSEQASTK